MNAPSLAQNPGDLLFRWEKPRRRRVAIAGFLLASAALHALCFYLFQVVYPPAISLLPPPAQVSVIAPSSPEARTFLNWLNAEDPAFATQTQRPADARAFQLPKLAHVPSYVAVPPRLKEPPARPTIDSVPSAMLPAPVPILPATKPPPPLVAPTTLVFSGALGQLPVTHPDLKFKASVDEAPPAARFRVAVDSSGVVRYLFLEQSSGDAALDEQARHYLALCRFKPGPPLTNENGLTWATASFEFGSDLGLPPTPAERAP
ncbi:MAG TPA: energy transducer TonB [Chthoniobacterales bacterium]|nr:energy transducer TonB [Chthoniobacterales bacterium]